MLLGYVSPMCNSEDQQDQLGRLMQSADYICYVHIICIIYRVCSRDQLCLFSQSAIHHIFKDTLCSHNQLGTYTI